MFMEYNQEAILIKYGKIRYVQCESGHIARTEALISELKRLDYTCVLVGLLVNGKLEVTRRFYDYVMTLQSLVCLEETAL
jgi:hypothetical protein